MWSFSTFITFRFHNVSTRANYFWLPASICFHRPMLAIVARPVLACVLDALLRPSILVGIARACHNTVATINITFIIFNSGWAKTCPNLFFAFHFCFRLVFGLPGRLSVVFHQCKHTSPFAPNAISSISYEFFPFFKKQIYFSHSSPSSLSLSPSPSLTLGWFDFTYKCIKIFTFLHKSVFISVTATVLTVVGSNSFLSTVTFKKFVACRATIVYKWPNQTPPRNHLFIVAIHKRVWLGAFIYHLIWLIARALCALVFACSGSINRHWLPCSHWWFLIQRFVHLFQSTTWRWEFNRLRFELWSNQQQKWKTCWNVLKAV